MRQRETTKKKKKKGNKMAKVKQSANLFSTASTVKVEPKKAKADNKEKIKIKGLEDFAMVVSLREKP